MSEQPVPQPRRDEFGVPLCQVTCQYYTGHHFWRCVLMSRQGFGHPIVVCEPAARADHADLQCLRHENQGLQAAVAVLRERTQRDTAQYLETVLAMAALRDLAEAAWGIIANAGGGDWARESPDWQEAAARWRDQYHDTRLTTRAPGRATHSRRRLTMATKIRLFDRLKVGAQEFVIPYGTAWIDADSVPDTFLEIADESADARNLDNTVRRACRYAQIFGAAARKAGAAEFQPSATHEMTKVNNIVGHFIDIRLNFGLTGWRMPLAVYDPARDSAAEGADLDTTADNCAAQVMAAMIYCASSDQPLPMSGGVSSQTEA